MFSRRSQEMIAERLRLLNKDITDMMPDRPDILHPANEALNRMVLLQDAITKGLPEEIIVVDEHEEDDYNG